MCCGIWNYFFVHDSSSGERWEVNISFDYRMALQKQEQILCKALHTDLGKSKTESVMCEIGLVQGEIRWMKQHLGRLCRTKHVRTPLAQFAAKSYRSPSPYGNVLIMSPWNYPVLLTLEPLVDAIAAGNTAVVKPSAYAPVSANALKDLLEEWIVKDSVCPVSYTHLDVYKRQVPTELPC